MPLMTLCTWRDGLQTMLGQKYAHGDGVDQSYQQARKLYELAASQGVDRNDERAAQYLELAADQGMAAAQTRLRGCTRRRNRRKRRDRWRRNQKIIFAFLNIIEVLVDL
jgi:TPR repeat protein